MRVAAVAATAFTAGCGRMPGRPGPESAEIRPDKVKNFDLLYAENCAACHGPNGRGSAAAIGLANPVYLAIADDAVLSRATAAGVPGTLMPAFAKSAGGTLTDEQVDDPRRRDPRAGRVRMPSGGAVAPAYAGPAGRPGARSRRLRRVLRVVPRRGRGGRTEGRVARGRLLPRSRQRPGLRTTVIAGRPDIGHARLAGRCAGRAADAAHEVADVVAWLASRSGRRIRAADGSTPDSVRREDT